MTADHERPSISMSDLELSAVTPIELAVTHREAEIRDMAVVLDEEIAALDGIIEAAKRDRATKLARLSVVQQAIPLAVGGDLE